MQLKLFLPARGQNALQKKEYYTTTKTNNVYITRKIQEQQKLQV